MHPADRAKRRNCGASVMPLSKGWGYAPSGVVGVLLVAGRIRHLMDACGTHQPALPQRTAKPIPDGRRKDC